MVLDYSRQEAGKKEELGHRTQKYSARSAVPAACGNHDRNNKES